MNDSLLMYIDHGFDNLTYIDPCLELSQSFPAFGQIFQRVVAAIFQQYVDILLVLEGVDKLYNMLVFQRSMDFYLDQ